MLLPREKSNAPILSETYQRDALLNVMFDNAKELVAGKMRELCDARGIKIIPSVPHCIRHHRIALFAECLVGVALHGTRTMLNDQL